MTELRKRMIETLQLGGLSERTREAYVRAGASIGPNPALRTPHSEPRTPNSELLTPNPALRTPNSEPRTPHSEPHTPKVHREN